MSSLCRRERRSYRSTSHDPDLWNIGGRDLADVVLTDDVYGMVDEVARLDSGERVHYTVADIGATITNVAEAVGTVLDFEVSRIRSSG